MAVQARLLSHAFPHDLHAFRAMEDATVGGSVLLDDYGGCVPAAAGIGDMTVLSDFPRSEVTCNYGFVPRKRPRVAAEGILEDQSVVLPPAVTQGLLPVPVGDVQNRAVGSGAASTSGSMADGAIALQSQGILSRLYHQGVEIDVLVRLETERMRAGLEEARRRHARALLAIVERAASGRLRTAEAELERALRRNAELEEKARQMGAEGQAWMGIAKSNEAVASRLRATLDQLLQSSCAATAAAAVGEGEAEDAQSCCFEAPAADANYDDDDVSRSKAAAASCKACSGGQACVLLLPCRHLCLCRACEATVDACPICAAIKNATLHVLVS
ncbi:probable BOI-related E3 ubiquitin-protein ligase 2 [Phragmites australis]|uniref:probable BOI-related E3 ubiquitin-protein ligase 2 n=1 Tax=Phragmites australis TaxID=29695 RepID=UPI002D78094C|nr:probable BOI-related E3 ubiquitin-protein ligase 2 [Phragmites australis]